jgi:hypothetical protein
MFIIFRSSDDRDFHPAKLINLVVLNFGKNQLITQTERVIATPIKGIGRNTTKIAHAG